MKVVLHSFFLNITGHSNIVPCCSSILSWYYSIVLQWLGWMQFRGRMSKISDGSWFGLLNLGNNRNILCNYVLDFGCRLGPFHTSRYTVQSMSWILSFFFFVWVWYTVMCLHQRELEVYLEAEMYLYLLKGFVKNDGMYKMVL